MIKLGPGDWAQSKGGPENWLPRVEGQGHSDDDVLILDRNLAPWG